MEEAKDFVNRVKMTLSGADLHDLAPKKVEETNSAESSPGLTTDYEDMDFGTVLNFDIVPEGPRVVSETLWKTKKRVEQTKEQLLKKVNSKREILTKEAAKPINVRLHDKIAFTLGVMNACLTCFAVGKFPLQFYWVYTLKLPFLMALRYHYYHKSKWHYFLLDFCYFVNALFFLYLHVFSDSCSLFKLCFAFTAGPLSWAIALWKNSMVFHSLDKITSLFIHISPSLVVWAIRWHPSERFNTCANEDSISWTDAVWYPLLVYCFWQLLYWFKVEVLDRHKFKNDPNYMTSYLWLTNDKQNKSLIYKLSNIYGKKYQVWWFGIWQLFYTFLTMLPVKLFYSSYIAHTLFLILLCGVSCWNGASFYIEVFSVKYQQTLVECEKHYERLSNILNEEKRQDKDKTS